MATGHVQCCGVFPFASIEEGVLSCEDKWRNTKINLLAVNLKCEKKVGRISQSERICCTFATTNDRRFVLSVAECTVKQLLCAIGRSTGHHPESGFVQEHSRQRILIDFRKDITESSNENQMGEGQ